MKNSDDRRRHYLKDPLPIRLGGLASNLERISSLARSDICIPALNELFEESCYFIEWTAADAEPEIAAELVHIQLMLGLWHKAWPDAQQHKTQRTILYIQAKKWSEQVLDYSGLLDR
ncbi:MAG: hypothetical protein U0350_16950 [Caldilineaceae bacterium]